MENTTLPNLAVAKVNMHWSEGWAKENLEFKTIRQFEEFVWRFICPLAPAHNEGYDKTKFTITLSNGDTYTGRWDVQKHHSFSYHIIDHCIDNLTWVVDNHIDNEIYGDIKSHIAMLDVFKKMKEENL